MFQSITPTFPASTTQLAFISRSPLELMRIAGSSRLPHRLMVSFSGEPSKLLTSLIVKGREGFANRLLNC